MKIRKRWIGAAAVLALLVSAVAIAQVTLVTSEWSSGNLVFKKVSDGSTLFTFNASGINFAAPGNLLIGGTALTPTAAELNEYLITIHDVDVCDTTSVYAVLPHAGTLNSAAVVPHGTIDSQTVLKLYLGAVDTTYLTEVSGATLTMTASAPAGRIFTNGAVTGGSTVTANSGVRVGSDGTCTSAIVGTVTIGVTR